MTYRLPLIVAGATALLAACGGGGGDDGSTLLPGKENTFTVAGTVSGLGSATLVLSNANGAARTTEDLIITGTGSGTVAFSFLTALPSTTPYTVSVRTAPNNLGCSVANGTGTINLANVTNIQVTCAPGAYTVSGTASNLLGAGLRLRNNGGDEIAVAPTATSFTFPTAVSGAMGYAVTVAQQPASPSQTCTTTSGASGAPTGGNISNVLMIQCVTDRFTIGGSISGLTGTGLQLQNSSGDVLNVLPGATSFAFPNSIASGSSFTVTIGGAISLPSQTCTAAPNTLSGVVGNQNIAIALTCTVNRYTVGGTVTGLRGGGFTLRLNGGNDLNVSASTAFAFPTQLDDQTTYAVTLQSAPSFPAQSCTITNGSGTINRANIANVVVACSDQTIPSALADARLRGMSVTWNSVVNAASYNLYVSSARNCNIQNYAACPDGALISNATSPHTVSSLRNGQVYFVTLETVYSNGARGLSSETGARPNALAFNEYVASMVVAPDGATYLGGQFTKVSVTSGSGAPIDTTTGRFTSPDFPMVTGQVFAAAADGAGGWYIGGDFTSVGGIARTNIAHILADNSVDANWNPSPNGFVTSFAVSGATVYVGGHFTTMSGVTRGRLAAISASGTLLPWNPDANGNVSALALSGTTIYAGGYFDTIGGVTRSRLAAIDTNGALLSWNPAGSNGSVNALAISGTTVYIGGGFSVIGGVTRNSVAAIDFNGTVLPWSANLDLQVYALATIGTTVYLGGSFTRINGTTRSHLAAIDANGTLLPWNPNPSGSYISSLATAGSTLYVGGVFDSIADTPRSNLAAFSANGEIQAWNPEPNARVHALAATSSAVYVGGSITGFGGTSRNYLAALGPDGSLLPWNPNANGAVGPLSLLGNTVYFSGSFTRVGGFPRNYLAAVDTNGTLQGWNPNLTGTAYAIAATSTPVGPIVYVGGFISDINGVPRNNLAALDINGSLTQWAPVANSGVTALAVSGSTVYAGGYFTNIGGVTRTRLAAFDAAGAGALQAWNPVSDHITNALVVSGSTVYAAGPFTLIGGVSHNYLAAIDSTTGIAQSWNPNPNNQVSGLAISGSTIYFGGNFTAVNGTPRNSAAAVDLAGAVLSWNPSVAGTTNNIAVSGNTVRLSGRIFGVGTATRGNFAEVSRTGNGDITP